MLEDGETILNLVGAVLVVGLLAAGGVVALNFDAPDGDDTAPDADWSVERVNDTYVRLTHAGGEPVRTEDLRVTVDSVERQGTTWENPVGPDDSTLVAASEGTRVRVVWLGGRGNRVVMDSWRV